MLQIKNLTITHKTDFRILLQDFSFVLNQGEKAAVIGEEGNGKLTLLRLIHEEYPACPYVEYTGEILKNGIRTGYLAQELDESELEKTVLEYCEGFYDFYSLSPREIAEISGRLSLEAELLYSDQKMRCLSGGEKVKVQFARLLMERPDVLLLDEPSNDLDLDMLAWMENFINTCGLPVMYISHDETLLARTANVIIHLEQSRRKTVASYTVVRTGYEEYVSARAARLTREEHMARREICQWKQQQERFRKIQQKVEHQQKSVSRQNPHGGALLKKKMHAVKALERRFAREQENLTDIPDVEEAIFLKLRTDEQLPASKRILELHDARIVLGEKVLAENLSLSVTGPEKICITGKNGTGKTTLLKEIAGILLGRRDIKAAYMPQDYSEILDMEKTPVDFLCSFGSHEEVSRIRTYLGSMKYTADEMKHRACQLSGGQKAKLLLLRMSLDGCNVLILDEPTRNFSPLSGPVIRRALKDYQGAVISVSHDRKYMEEVCDKRYCLTEKGLLEMS